VTFRKYKNIKVNIINTKVVVAFPFLRSRKWGKEGGGYSFNLPVCNLLLLTHVLFTPYRSNSQRIE